MNSFFRFFVKTSSPLLAVLVIWTGFSAFFEPYVLPSPFQTFTQAAQFFTVDFLVHWKWSIFRILSGSSMAFFLGVTLAIMTVTLKVNKFAESMYTMGQTVPAVIVAVIFLVMFGTGNSVPILLIVVMVTPFVALQVMGELSRPTPILKMVIKSNGGKTKELIRDLYIPQLIPSLRASAIISTTMGVKVCILGEFVGSENGLGFLINVARMFLNMEEVLFYVTIILLQMFCFQVIIDTVFRLFFKKYFYPE